MRKIIFSILIGMFCIQIAVSQNSLKFERALKTDDSRGEIKIGALRSDVEKTLGAPDFSEDLSGVTHLDYYTYEVSVFIDTETKRVISIGVVLSNEAKSANLKTDKGIDRDSTEEDVLRLYGEPKKIKEGANSRTFYYEGIWFVFKNKKLSKFTLFAEKY